MELSDLLSTAKSLPLFQQRRVAAIVGSLVADAAGNIYVRLADRAVHGVAKFIG